MKIVFICISALLLFSCSKVEIKYPETKKVNTVDTYFGVNVPDPYRWLESDTSAEVTNWVKEQNKITFGYLEKIPFREKVKERLSKIWNYPKYTSPFREGKNYFYYKNDGLQNQYVVYKQNSLDSEGEPFLDPNTFSSDGTIALAGLSFSSDGKYVAYNISQSGSDWRKIYVMDVDTKEKLSDEIIWVKFSGASWFKNGFFYSRFDTPVDSERVYSERSENHKVFYHKLGTDQKNDILVYEDSKHPLRLLNINVSEDETIAYLSVFEKGSKGSALYCRTLNSLKGQFKPVLETFDDHIYPVTNNGSLVIAFTDRNSPNGRIITFDVNNPGEKSWKTLIPEGKEMLSNVTSAGGKLFVTYLRDVVPHVYVYSLNGKMEREVKLPDIGTISGFGGKRDDSLVFYTMSSFTNPSIIYKYDILTGNSTIFRKTEIDFPSEQYETKQVFFTSKDGQKIPMFLVHRKGLKMDGTNPVFIYGYGGFNDIILPQFNISRLLWLEQGGIYASVNLRGGSEYGEKWHEVEKTKRIRRFYCIC